MGPLQVFGNGWASLAPFHTTAYSVVRNHKPPRFRPPPLEVVEQPTPPETFVQHSVGEIFDQHSVGETFVQRSVGEVPCLATRTSPRGEEPAAHVSVPGTNVATRWIHS